MFLPTLPRTPSPRQGATTFWLVVSLGVIIAIVALTMDGGRMMDERRRARAAADAAALAAAADLYNNYWTYQGSDTPGTAKQAALTSAATNGYSNDGAASVVTVNIPPQSGTFKGQAGYVEVIVQSNIRAGFSSVFTSGNLTVRGRAVARGQPQPIGAQLLQSSGPGALSLGFNASLSLVKGPLNITSSDSQAIQLALLASLSAPVVNLTASLGLGGLLGLGLTVNTNVAPSPDPLQTLSAPDPTQYPVQSSVATTISGSTSVTLQPGVYQGGIAVSGSASVTLQPGVYILQGGGLQVSGNASISGNGVMIYNTTDALGASGAITLNTYGTINLTPPTSGSYAGISLFQDRTLNTALQITANASIQMPGIVYAPAASVNLSGSVAGNILGGGYIVSSLQVSANAQVNINPLTNFVKAPDVRLVE
jgi:hypothetical protein